MTILCTAQEQRRSPHRAAQRCRNLFKVYAQIPWQRSANFHPRAGRGMRKPDARRVQEIALQERKIARARAQAARRAVERVTHNWMPDRGKVRADLVRASGMKHSLDQRASVQTRDHAPVGSRVPALVPARGHSRPPVRIARNGQRDRSGIARHFAMNQRQINFPDVAGTELFGKMFVRFVIPRDDHGTRGFFVQAMHDPRTQRAARARKFSQAVQQRVHQRSARVARAGMDHHPGGLVHNDEIVVHQQQFERQIFRRGHQRGPGQDFDLNGFSSRDPVRGPRRAPVDPHIAFADQFLNPRAAQRRDALREKQIQPASGVA